MQSAGRIYLFAERIVTAIAGIALLLMMLMVVHDIAGRSLGLWHVLSSVEQTTLYMMLLGFFGLVRCFRAQGNIVVDVATQSLPAAHVRRIDAGSGQEGIERGARALARAALEHDLAGRVRGNGFRLERRQGVQHRTVNAQIGVFVRLAHIDEHDGSGLQAFEDGFGGKIAVIGHGY